MSEKIIKILENHERRISAIEEALKRKPRRTLLERKSTEDLLIELKNEGFFKDDKTISQIRDALHAKGRIVKITDLPPYLLKLVREGVLNRRKALIGRRKTWVYFAQGGK